MHPLEDKDDVADIEASGSSKRRRITASSFARSALVQLTIVAGVRPVSSQRYQVLLRAVQRCMRPLRNIRLKMHLQSSGETARREFSNGYEPVVQLILQPPPKALDDTGLPYSTDPTGSVHSYPQNAADWVYREVAPSSVIQSLVEFYSAVIYPILVDHHLPTLLSRVRDRQYATSRPIYADIMALCALSSARIRDGASSPNHPITAGMLAVPSEVYYQAALDAIPIDISLATGFEYKRAKLTLAFLCIQYVDTRGMQRQLGDFCTMSAMDGFHLESRWPEGLNEIEIQERRRLFWQAYQLDIYTSCTWGGTARHREAETTVLYPAEVVSDDNITSTSIHLAREADEVSFWRGWNFVTDLYRILEHAMEKGRMRQIGKDPSEDEKDTPSGQGGPISALFRTGSGPGQAEIMQVVNQLYGELPEVLRVAAPLSEDEARNRLGFQATNIIITLQTLRMVVAGSGESSVSQRCEIAGHLLDAISNVPTAYIYASSAPVLHHLAGVGHLLGSVASRPQTLSPWTYLQVRNCLLSMADMLAGLESVLSRAAGIAERLRTHIERIDQFMALAAKERAGRGLVHSVVKLVPEAAEKRPGAVEGVRANAPFTDDARRGGPSDEELAITDALAYIDTGPPVGLASGRVQPLATSAQVSLPPNLGHSYDLSLFDFGAFQHDASVGESDEVTGTINSRLIPDTHNATAPQYNGILGPLDTTAAPDTIPDDLFTDWSFILGDAFAFLGDNADTAGQR